MKRLNATVIHQTHAFLIKTSLQHKQAFDGIQIEKEAKHQIRWPKFAKHFHHAQTMRPA